MIPAAERGCEETGGFFSPRTPEPGPAGSWTSSWRCCKLGITNNMRLELLCRQESSRAIRKQRGFLKNELVRFSEIPAVFPCALVHRWAGIAGLPGSGMFSFPPQLRHTAWEMSLIPSASGGVRGGTSSPAGSGAAPQRPPAAPGQTGAF